MAGPDGRVFSIEPVSLFRKILTVNLSNFKNTTIVPYALGTEDNKSIQMGIPQSNKYLRHGLTRVLDANEDGAFEFTFTEKMYKPITIFGHLERCDYIKCDVEGYEIHIIPQLEFLLTKFQPVIQIEIEPSNSKVIYDFLSTFNYSIYYLKKGILFPVTGKAISNDGDLFFIPESKIKVLKSIIA